MQEAIHLGHRYTGTEDLLLGLVGDGENVAAVVLVSLRADPVTVRHEVATLISNGGERRDPESVKEVYIACH